MVVNAFWTLAVPRLVNTVSGCHTEALNRLLGWTKRFSLSLFLLEREMKTDHDPW